VRLLLPAFLLSSPSLSFSPFSPFSYFTHLQPEGQRSLKLNCHSNIAPRRQSFETSIFKKWRGAWAPVYMSTEQHLHGVNYKRGSASGRGSTGGDQRHWRLKKKKRQRQKHVRHWQLFTRADFLGDQFPAKFGCQPIKLELAPLVHAYPANYVRVHFGISGVYKESRVACRAIQVRVS